MSALWELLAWHESGKVVLLCSPVVEEEQADIPPQYPKAHRMFYEKFARLPKAERGGLTQLGPHGLPMRNPRDHLFRSLEKILKGKDTWHVFIASRQYLITGDRRTMLSKKEAVLKISGVHLVLPLRVSGSSTIEYSSNQYEKPPKILWRSLKTIPIPHSS